MGTTATRLDLEVFPGATLLVEFTVQNDAGSTFDPTGYTFIFKSAVVATGIAIHTVNPTFPTPSLSVARVEIIPTDTRAYAIGRKSNYALEVRSPDGKQEIAFYGFITGLSAPNND